MNCPFCAGSLVDELYDIDDQTTIQHFSCRECLVDIDWWIDPDDPDAVERVWAKMNEK